MTTYGLDIGSVLSHRHLWGHAELAAVRGDPKAPFASGTGHPRPFFLREQCAMLPPMTASNPWDAPTADPSDGPTEPVSTTQHYVGERLWSIVHAPQFKKMIAVYALVVALQVAQSVLKGSLRPSLVIWAAVLVSHLVSPGRFKKRWDGRHLEFRFHNEGMTVTEGGSAETKPWRKLRTKITPSYIRVGSWFLDREQLAADGTDEAVYRWVEARSAKGLSRAFIIFIVAALVLFGLGLGFWVSVAK